MQKKVQKKCKKESQPGQILGMSQLFRCPAKAVPVNLGQDPGDEVWVELHLAHLHVPRLDQQRIACHNLLQKFMTNRYQCLLIKTKELRVFLPF